MFSVKSTGSKSIEEEEEDLAQICLTGEEYVLEEKQELDLFLETEQESQTGTQSDDVITPSNTIDVTETGREFQCPFFKIYKVL